MTEVIIPLSVFAMIVAIVYLNVRKRERLALIEKGLNANMFEARRSLNPALKWGIILVALGLGLIMARISIQYGGFDREEAYFAMLFLFGGAGLLIYYFIERTYLKQAKGPAKENDESVN